MSFPGSTQAAIPYRSSDIVFGRVMEELESFDAAGLIDRGKFYTYVKEILHNLDAAIYIEDEAILEMKNFTHCLPSNFCSFWAAYSCRPDKEYLDVKGYNPTKDITLFTMLDQNPYSDNLINAVNKNWKYEIECPSELDRTSKIAVRYYIDGDTARYFNFTEPALLSFGKTPNSLFCDGGSPCYRSGNPNHISIDSDKNIWSNFDGPIYLMYYGMAIDKKTGLPQIPDNSNIEKAIEFYIEYRLIRFAYLNNKLPDLEKRMMLLKAEADDAWITASNEAKTPSFQAMIKIARNNKRRFRVFQLNTHNYHY